MATDALEGTDLHVRPAVKRPGLLDRLLAFVDGLPGPALLWYLVFGAILALAGHMFMWASAERAFPEISHDIIAPALMFSWFAWLLHILNAVARRSFNEFRPALGDPDLEEHYLSDLTSIRDRDAIAAGSVAIVVVAAFYYLAVRPTQQLIPPEIERVSAPLWGIAVFVLGIVVLHTINQLRLVSHLSLVARSVDIFKPAQINAFARLTVVSALGLIAFVIGFILFSPSQPIAYIVEEALLLLVAVAAFVLPLNVMHRRLAAEKTRLLGESQDRLKRVLAQLHAAVDSDDLTRSEQLNEALTAVMAEQEVIGKLHTWPWSASVFRGFASALLIPIALIVLSQVLDRVI
jgi:hypothetical protein